MSFEIYPQSINIYPEDTQTFTVRSTPPPIIWDALQNYTLNSDGTISCVTLGALFGGLLTPRVHDGIAGIEWTLSADMIPDTGGELQLRLFGVGTRLPTHALQVYVGPTSTLVEDEDGATLDTVTHTVAAGDKFYLEVAGNLFRLFINGTVEVEYEVTTATEYPIRASVFGDGDFVSATPKIGLPRLVGVWNLEPLDVATLNAWTVTGGTLSDSSDTWQTVFTAGTKPGVYSVSCEVGGEDQQTVTATVVIPPLSILGETDVTLQPSQKYRFRTNYDNAQDQIVTWSVASGGGSFANGEYTAASAPGSSVVVATYGDQEVSITVRVPAVMTVLSPTSVAVTAAKLGEVLTLSTNMTGTINWTATAGSLSAGTGATVTWTAPNQEGVEALIVATNGTYTVTTEISVLQHFPYDPTQNVIWERKKNVLVSTGEDRSRAARVKDYNNAAYEPFELKFLNRNLAEYTAASTFWQARYPGTKFIYEDKIRSLRREVYFDSDIRTEGYSRCAIDYSFRLIEAA